MHSLPFYMHANRRTCYFVIFPHTVCVNAGCHSICCQDMIFKDLCCNPLCEKCQAGNGTKDPGRSSPGWGLWALLPNPVGSRYIFAWHRGKDCMTSGGHYVSKILLKPNSCIFFLSFFFWLPSSHVVFEIFFLLFDALRLPRTGASGSFAQDLGSWGSRGWPGSPGRAWIFGGVPATSSFPCTIPGAASRWSCEQVRLPRCDLHKPLKALNIYPQNSIKLFIKSNAWNLGSPWKYYNILPEVPESSSVGCVCIFRLLIFVYH